MLDEQLAALRAMPVRLRHDFHGDLLPEGAPSARVIASLEALGLVVLVHDGESGTRWVCTTEGQRELERWSRKAT